MVGDVSKIEEDIKKSAQDHYAKDEYKVGHNKPPLFLIVIYMLVLTWCAISWIPFYGY